MEAGALDGVVAIEVAESIGAAYCGKLLADLGARVIVIEPPEGHRLRERGPTRAGASTSGLFAHFALNKESAVLNVTSASDVATFGSMLAAANILITDGATSLLPLLAADRPPGLVEVDVSALGRTGPYRDWKANAFTTWAMGGYMYFTGEHGREPLALHGAQADFHAGTHAAFAALAGLYEQRRSGHGQHVEISALEAVLSAHSWLTVAWSHAGTVLERTTHDLTRCADGWVCFMRGVMYTGLFFMIERPELIDDPRWADLPGWAAHMPEIYGMVGEWCATHTRKEVVEAAQELRIACLPLNDAGDLDRSAQLEARGWWLSVDDPQAGQIRLPGFPYMLSETPARVRTPSPTPDAHAVLRPREPTGAAEPGGSTAERPLAGLRVLELTSNWAGPVCGRHLGDLGAEIIKVESPTRPATRGGFWPHQDPQRQGYNRAGYFNQMNRNKRDLVLDLTDAQGRELFLELVCQADVLIENNSARVMPNLGLSYETLAQENPRLIMASISGSGGSGPERDYVAYGSTVEASSGLAALVGYDDSQPYRTGSYYADPVAGAHAAVAILAALEYRRTSGRGQWIDVSLNESSAAFFAEALIEYQVTGTAPPRRGNRSGERCPQGAFPCVGLDNWIAISVQDDAEWPALCSAIGRDDLRRPGLTTLAGRIAAVHEIEDAIRVWTREQEQYDAVWLLQNAGVTAAPVLANWQLLADRHLFERGFYVPIVHPVVGVYPFPSWPWRFSRTPAAVRRYSPLFGEHNREILRELGLDDEGIESLYARNVTTDTPILA